ncbi:unnamed protein product [Plutella xylostella]|uniref:(diamondback moth) hypothetical protein n=1 Tax=Plutella xylostella TaxID=51655 RepID=A0A8S4DLE2_PLUXY|nr:unnamed protein product [Plutella xylostella]
MSGLALRRQHGAPGSRAHRAAVTKIPIQVVYSPQLTKLQLNKTTQDAMPITLHSGTFDAVSRSCTIVKV